MCHRPGPGGLPLPLRLSEGLGFSARGSGAGCIFMPGIVLPAPRYGKSSRGTPPLRRPVLPLQGALRLAVLTKKLNPRRSRRAATHEARLRSMSSFHFSITATLA
jgi:hypothetical protein